LSGYPGACQVCGQYRVIDQYWPSTIPARYVDLCRECRELGDEEISRRLPEHRRDKAST
jgi:hypothetical protein